MRKLIASLKIHTTITLCRNIYKTTFLMKNIQIIIFSLSSINNFLILEQFFVMNMTKMMIHCKFKKVIIDKKSTRLTTIHFKITISFAMKKMNKNLKNLKDLFACPQFYFQVKIQNMNAIISNLKFRNNDSKALLSIICFEILKYYTSTKMPFTNKLHLK